MSLNVRLSTPADAGAWDRFVLAHQHGSPFHMQAWRRSIGQVFGYESCSLLAESAGELRGVLPLFHVRNPLMGRVLLSSPFAVYGGILAADEAAQAALGDAARQLARDENVEYAEFRNAWDQQCSGLPPLRRYATFTQQLASTEQEILDAIPRKTRAMVRKALKFNFSSRSTRDLSRFFDLYSRNLRRLGTPCFPFAHFRALLDNFGEAAGVREILLDGRAVAAVLTFYFRDQILPYYGASDPAFNAYAPNNFMYFELMRDGARAGFRTFDFGRSKLEESGSFDFKAHWGMQMRELPYEILLVRRREMPDYSPNNPRFQAAIRFWQHVPLPLTRLIGPWLVKLVP